MFEAESQQTPILSPEGIKIAKGEEVKVEKRVVPFIESSLKELSLSGERDNMARLCRWHHQD